VVWRKYLCIYQCGGKKLRQIGIVLVVLLSLFLHFTHLGQVGLANLYYAAGVKSMMMNWHNFFFVSSDPGGFITIDKPPLGFWIQTISAKIFGFQGWSLILPQALAGVTAVYLIYVLVKQHHEVGAGLIAGLVLALTPIFVAASRNNTIDVLLAMTMLFAALAFLPAKQELGLKKLLLAFFIIGIGFNIKSLEAFLVLPAFYITYFFAQQGDFKKKCIHLLMATLVLIVTSLPWFIAVDSISPEERPYVGSSQTNSEFELATGYNGLGHFLGSRVRRPGQTPVSPRVNVPMTGNTPQFGGIGETGTAGLFRLFNRQIGGQISWLLPLALIGILIGLYQARKGELPARSRTAILFWSCWLIPEMTFFSMAHEFRLYYLVMMAPAIAALAGISYSILTHWFTNENKRRYILLLALVITIGSQAWIIAQYTEWRYWMLSLVIGVGLLAVFMLGLLARSSRKCLSKYNQFVVWACVISLFIAPFAWSLTPVLYGAGNPSSPFAGPDLNPQSKQVNTPGVMPNLSGRMMGVDTSKLGAFLMTHKSGEKYIVAVPNAHIAAPIILDTGEPVITYGGFSGSEKILNAEELEQFVESGQVRYILAGIATASSQQPEIDSWVLSHGVPVPDSEWKTAEQTDAVPNASFNSTRRMPMRLYDCSSYLIR
jgi:4-amino-4-deoxy-L-arabinose transferase-like glycosyltransferase